MQVGIFAKIFVRATWQETFAAAKSHGLECLQFNFSCAGLATLPENLDPALLSDIRDESKRLSLGIAAVSGTCNLVHPDLAQRSRDLIHLQRLITACRSLGPSVVTLCTGTRDPLDMWRRHRENDSAAAWRDLVAALGRLLPVAENAKMVLGIEPEPANVIDSAVKARNLLDEFKSPWLKIVFDAANLVEPGNLARQSEILRTAVELLGEEVVIAHAKDVAGEMARYVAAGQGKLDYAFYLDLLRRAGFDGPVILHSLSEEEVPAAVSFIRNNLNHAHAADSSRPS
jgi:sugar phosphate isomerase/epimerase